jgi:nitroreductase
MDVFDAVRTRLEIREYTDEPVPEADKRAILDAARLSPSGRNLQHWRFILVTDPEALSTMAEVSTTGQWIDGAAFAVIVLTDPSYEFDELDAGRAITHMQLVAWERDVGSCIYTGFNADAMHAFFDIPTNYAVTAVVGFGYPDREVRGRKRRRPLEEIAFDGRFDQPYDRE